MIDLTSRSNSTELDFKSENDHKDTPLVVKNKTLFKISIYAENFEIKYSTPIIKFKDLLVSYFDSTLKEL
jgi:hypothetical protein